MKFKTHYNFFALLGWMALGLTLGSPESFASNHKKTEEAAQEASHDAASTVQAESAVTPSHWYSNLGLDTGAHWGIGRMGSNTNNVIPNRTMNTLSLQALPGYRIQNFLVGPYFEYLIVGQNTDPSDPNNLNLNNQDIKGSGYLLGVGASYDYDKFIFGGAFTFLGNYNLSKQDEAGFYIQYQKPIGIHLQAGYRVYKKITADLKYSMVTYSQDNIANVANDVSTNKRSHWDLALGGTLHFDFK